MVAEEINYYAILLELRKFIYKFEQLTEFKDIDIARYELLSYIYSISPLKEIFEEIVISCKKIIETPEFTEWLKLFKSRVVVDRENYAQKYNLDITVSNIGQYIEEVVFTKDKKTVSWFWDCENLLYFPSISVLKKESCLPKCSGLLGYYQSFSNSYADLLFTSLMREYNLEFYIISQKIPLNSLNTTKDVYAPLFLNTINTRVVQKLQSKIEIIINGDDKNSKLDLMVTPETLKDLINQLTNEEYNLVQAMQEGFKKNEIYTSKELAKKLGKDITTINTQFKHIKDKTNLGKKALEKLFKMS